MAKDRKKDRHKNTHHRRKYQRLFQKEWALKNKYGLTLEDYKDLLKAQDNKCKICSPKRQKWTDI